MLREQTTDTRNVMAKTGLLVKPVKKKKINRERGKQRENQNVKRHLRNPTVNGIKT